MDPFYALKRLNPLLKNNLKLDFQILEYFLRAYLELSNNFWQRNNWKTFFHV